MKNLISLGLKHIDGELLVLDQQLLPQQEKWIQCKNPLEMIELIQCLKIRGAPLIGVAAALCLAKFSESGASSLSFREAALALRKARPTAINLMAAVDQLLGALNPTAAAEAIFEEDVLLCEQIAQNGCNTIHDGDGVLTHCNAGGLATAGIGTALGIVRKAFEQGCRFHVYVDETRPLLQGARLTTWELAKLGIPHTLICDNMAADLMKKGKITKIFVGADRIAANGDFANKVGTYSLAVLAHYHQIAFYPAAPHTTVDLECKTGQDIPIEERQALEVQGVLSRLNSNVYNPAFDVTPAKLVTALILDKGVFNSVELCNGAIGKCLQGGATNIVNASH